MQQDSSIVQLAGSPGTPVAAGLPNWVPEEYVCYYGFRPKQLTFSSHSAKQGMNIELDVSAEYKIKLLPPWPLNRLWLYLWCCGAMLFPTCTPWPAYVCPHGRGSTSSPRGSRCPGCRSGRKRRRMSWSCPALRAIQYVQDLLQKHLLDFYQLFFRSSSIKLSKFVIFVWIGRAWFYLIQLQARCKCTVHLLLSSIQVVSRIRIYPLPLYLFDSPSGISLSTPWYMGFA